MNRLCRRALGLVAAGMTAAASSNSAQPAGGAPTLPAPENAAHLLPHRGSVNLFTFFRDNGQDGLFLAWSVDGLDWHEIQPPGKSFLVPQVGGRLMRDPCLRRGADGVFHLVWTTGWNDRGIGHASSRDLVHWSPQQEIPVMGHEPTARNAWAPELFLDRRRGEFLLFWASTIPGRFAAEAGTSEDAYDHRMYLTTTRDFRTFTPTRLFYDGGFNVIDATLVQAGRRRFGLVVKDERLKPARKNLRIAWGSDPQGPFGPASEPFSPSWVEGPSVLRVGRDWLIYFDHYTSPHYYGALRSRDLQHWEDISREVHLPKGTRHGTALTVPARVLQALLQATTAPPP